MKILITGTNGQVVTAMKTVAADSDHNLIALGRPDIDLLDPKSLREPVLEANPDIIISAAAYTAVDKAETEPGIAHIVNAESSGALAKIANELGVPIVHLSTDYVFDGHKTTPYVETDTPAPINIYGQTKLKGEQAIAAHTSNHAILRTAWVYSPFGNNFVKTMLRLSEDRDEIRVVSDQLGCPTSAMEIARALLKISNRLHTSTEHSLRGIFHLTAQGNASWSEFAVKVLEGSERRGKPTAHVLPITTEDYPTPAKRPKYSWLSGEKLRRVYGLELPAWEKSLEETLDVLLGKGS